MLFLPGDIFASHAPDPVLQQVEDFEGRSISANDCFRPVSRYFERIMEPAQLLTSLPRALAVLTDPVQCGPVTLALPQDVQAEAFEVPDEFLEQRVWHVPRPIPDDASLRAAAAAIRAARRPRG